MGFQFSLAHLLRWFVGGRVFKHNELGFQGADATYAEALNS